MATREIRLLRAELTGMSFDLPEVVVAREVHSLCEELTEMSFDLPEEEVEVVVVAPATLAEERW